MRCALVFLVVAVAPGCLSGRMTLRTPRSVLTPDSWIRVRLDAEPVTFMTTYAVGVRVGRSTSSRVSGSPRRT
jgi:hypothetical protein